MPHILSKKSKFSTKSWTYRLRDPPRQALASRNSCPTSPEPRPPFLTCPPCHLEDPSQAEEKMLESTKESFANKQENNCHKRHEAINWDYWKEKWKPGNVVLACHKNSSGGKCYDYNGFCGMATMKIVDQRFSVGGAPSLEFRGCEILCQIDRQFSITDAISG